jgi:hypothetical protein
MNEESQGRKQACHIKNKTLTFAQRDGKKLQKVSQGS